MVTVSYLKWFYSHNLSSCRLLLARERNKPYEENKDYGWLGATMDVLSPLDGSVAVINNSTFLLLLC